MEMSGCPVAVGITGGMGCGKTTVVDVFAELGIPAFVADRVGASYYQEPEFCHEVARLLGADLLITPDTINKALLAQRVFSDVAALEVLNGLVHPRVMADFDVWRKKQLSPYVLFESAILYDYGFDRQMDATIVVHLDMEERMRRLLLRDSLSADEIKLRMACQLSSDVLLDRANYVILNYEGNPRRRQVQYVHQHLLSHFVVSADKVNSSF